MLGLPFDDQVSINDARYMDYSRNKERTILKEDILYRQYYKEVVDINHLQVILPVQLFAAILKSLDGIASKHPGITEMMQQRRREYYFPSIAKYVRNWVQQCETCIKDKRINNMKLRPELLKNPERDMDKKIPCK